MRHPISFAISCLMYGTFIVLSLLSQPVAAQDDQTWNTWNHNGSTMYLEWSGRSRKIYYLNPRDGLISRGVRQGTLLFSGTREDFNYSGTAYVFSLCGPIGYQVTGSLASDLQHIRLIGQVPIVDRDCKVSSYRNDVLEFNTTDDDDCGCQCPSEIPVADVNVYFKDGVGTSCPYLYAWSTRNLNWNSYGKVIHSAQGRDRKMVEAIKLREFSTRLRLSEEEPENSFIEKIELRVETEEGAIYALKPLWKGLVPRKHGFNYISAYSSIEFSFELPTGINPVMVRDSTLYITGYYERISSSRPTQCYARIASARNNE